MSDLSVALETSTRPPSIAVRLGTRERSAELSGTRSHAADLLPTLEGLIGELGGAPERIASVIVGTGPGSYTGLRVGIATALGLARASGAALCGIPSTETLVAGAVPVGSEAAVVIDARSGEVYFARYRHTVEGIDCLHAPCVIRAAELSALLPPGARVIADGDAQRAALLGQRTDLSIDPDARPHARVALALGRFRIARRGGCRPADLEPLYLRAFAAKSRRR